MAINLYRVLPGVSAWCIHDINQYFVYICAGCLPPDVAEVDPVASPDQRFRLPPPWNENSFQNSDRRLAANPDNTNTPFAQGGRYGRDRLV